MQHSTRRRTGPEAGFSLVELLVVVAIIAVLAAVAVPITMAYLRNYSINGAATMVASEIQSARTQAIKRNVNWGVVFVTVTDQQFRFVSEDIPPGPDCPTYPPCAFTRVPINVGAAVDPAVLPGRGPGPLRNLPADVIFDTPATGADQGFRFNRFGAMCDPGAGVNCPDLPTAYPPFVGIDPVAGVTIRLLQPSTGLTRTVTVAPGGRVSTQ